MFATVAANENIYSSRLRIRRSRTFWFARKIHRSEFWRDAA